MDSKTIGDIIAIVSPTITLIITVLAVLNNRIEKTTAPLDAPTLKILKIKRYPINKKDFNRIVRRFVIVLAVIVLLELASIIYLFFLQNNLDIRNPYSIISIILTILSLIFLFIFVRYSIYSLDFRKNLIYRNIDIIIDADFQYLFDKCVGSLKKMNLKIIEVELGNNRGFVKALQLKFFSDARIITVKVHKMENSPTSFTVELEFSSSLEDHIDNLLEKSKITNSFIDKLISKPSAKAGDNKQS